MEHIVVFALAMIAGALIGVAVRNGTKDNVGAMLLSIVLCCICSIFTALCYWRL